MSAVDDIVRRNHRRTGTDSVMGGVQPTLGLALLLCMDWRIDPFVDFGVRRGEVHLVRNAGGLVTDDALRTLAISQHAFGTREVMVVQHTDCGMSRIDNNSFDEYLADYAGIRPPWTIGGFSDLELSVQRSLTAIETSPFLVHDHRPRGFIYRVETGLLEEVSPR